MRREVSIVIVNYNTGNFLYNCLDSIRRCVDVDYEVIVADNASTDDSLSLCAPFFDDPRFVFLRLRDNLGFARANNIAADRSAGVMIHFLNPDTEVREDINDDYRKALLSPQSVYVNPLLNRDGSMENRPMPVPTVRNMLYWYFRRRKCIMWYKGASVIISSELFKTVGKWSEDYFMYAEDLDFFYTLSLHGVPVTSLSSVIYHYGGASSSKQWTTLGREIAVQKSTRIFYKKYFSKCQYVAVKIYFILHYIVKNPRRVPLDIKAWRMSGEKKVLHKC